MAKVTTDNAMQKFGRSFGSKKTAREKVIIEIAKRHLPAKRYHKQYGTGGPVCGLLDILALLGAKLPYRLDELKGGERVG